jgi:hypothetical protein
MRMRVVSTQANLDEADGRQAISPIDVYTETIEKIMQESADDVIQWLATSAVDGSHVLETLTDLALRLGNTSSAHFTGVISSRMRMSILELIRESPLDYSLEVVSTYLSTLTGGQR